MCPIHETDSGEERWSQAEWEHYELWEKTEARARRIRQVWIAIACVLFLGLSAIPVMRERQDRWKTLGAASEFARELNRLKTLASSRQSAVRLRLDPGEPLSFYVEWGSSCRSSVFQEREKIQLLSLDSDRSRLSWISSEQAKRFGVSKVLDEWCFHPLEGSVQTPQPDDSAAFLIAPVKELAPERGSLVLVSGPFAEISFE